MSESKLVEIEDIAGRVHWVNPVHVTGIEPQSAQAIRNSGTRCIVWVVGHAGYNTYQIRSPKSAAEVAEHINKNYE